MARKASEEINWKPRRQRNTEVLGCGEHVQMSLPFVAGDVLAGDESRVELVAPEPGDLLKPSESVALHWQPRSQE